MVTRKLKAGIFIRVSTEDQNLTNQRFHLMELLKFRGYEYYKTYEYIQSAFTEHHSSTSYLNEIREDARLCKFDVLLIWSLDRLSRRGIKHTLDIVSELAANNIQIVSSKESFIESFTDNPLMRELFISMLAFVAGFESERKSERIKAALERKKKQGLPIGKPKGAKDTKPRRKRGYLENKNALSKKVTKEIREILDDKEVT